MELKAVLKKQAAREGKIDLGDPAYRFTMWSDYRSYFYYEGHAEYDDEMAPRLGELMVRDKSRVAILDILEDRLYLYSVEIR